MSKWRCFALLALALTLSACGGGAQPGYTAQQQTVDGLVIGLERPQQAEILKDYELFVTLNDATGKPVDGAIPGTGLGLSPSFPTQTGVGKSADNFISASRDDFVDPRFRAVSLADVFPANR